MRLTPDSPCIMMTFLSDAPLAQLERAFDFPLFPQEIQGLERLRQVAAVLGPGLHESSILD